MIEQQLNKKDIEINCKYCEHKVSKYYLHLHYLTKRCKKIQEIMNKEQTLLKNVLNNDTSSCESKICVLCNKRILRQAKQRGDEKFIDYSKVHKKCLNKQLLKQNSKYALTVVTENVSIEI
jgi:hypothetical protein